MISRKKIVVTCRKPEETNVKQSFKNSTDIHAILERVQMGDYALFDSTKGRFMDLFDTPEDLSEAYRRVDEVDELFANLPSKLREHFNHNVVEFAEWLDVHHSEKDILELIQSVSGEMASPLSAEKKHHPRNVVFDGGTAAGVEIEKNHRPQQDTANP